MLNITGCSRRPARGGYGLMLIMVFLAGMIMIGTSMQLIGVPALVPYVGNSSQNNLAAQSLAAVGMQETLQNIQSNRDSNVTVDTSYTHLPLNPPSMPADPTALGGATTPLGNWSASITQARGDAYMVKVTATVGGSTASLSRLVSLSRKSKALDIIGAPQVAYGLRKLRYPYSGYAVRVRRSYDNAVADIGFTSTGDLDLYSPAVLNAGVYTGGLYDFLLYQAYNAGVVGKTILPLDLTSAAAAFGMRRLRFGYTGPLLKVRRSGDNTTSDIGFTVSGDLDVNALLNFVGSGTGYVATWYDQSGNGVNATQSVPGEQPTIVTSGRLNTVDNRPAIKYDGVDDSLLFNRTISTNFSILACFSTIAGQTWSGADDAWGGPFFAGLVDADASGTNTQDFTITIDSSGKPHFGTNGATYTAFTLPTPGGSVNDGRMHWLAMTRNNSTAVFSGYSDDASYAQLGSTGALNGSSTIGLGKSRTTGLAFSGYTAEVIAYATVLPDVYRLALARDEGWYYNMPPAAPSITPPMDAMAGMPSVACGLRKLRAAYAGSAIQVRSSAGGTANIGFTASGDLDVKSLLDFVGSNNGYVTTCYDQSTNGRNLTQSTAANQPRIVNAGVLDTMNGRPAMYFNGSSYLTYATGGAAIADLTGTVASGFAIFNVPAASSPTTDFSRVLSAYKNGHSDNASSDSAIFVEAGGNNLRPERAGQPFNVQNFSYGSVVLGGAKFDGANATSYLNGAASGPTALSGTSNFAIDTIRVGSSSNLNPYEFLLGYLGEVYLYPWALDDGQRATVEKNMLQYFNAPLAAGYVTTWYDQSGNGNNATQVVPLWQPTINMPRYGSGNNRPTITFNGRQRLSSTGGMPTSSDYTKNAVFSYYSNAGYNNIISSNKGHGLYNAGSHYFRLWHTGDFATSSTATAFNTHYSISASFAQSSMTGSVYLRNGLVGSGTSPSSATNPEIYLGAWGDESYLSGTISEALVFNRVLSDQERTLIYNEQCAYFGAQ